MTATSTLPAALNVGSAQLFSYVQTWANARYHQFDTNPMAEDLTRIDVTRVADLDRVRLRITNNYLQGGNNHYRRLLDLLGVEEGSQKEAWAGGVGYTAWFWQEQHRLPWYHVDRKRADWVIDDLFQLNRCLEQTAVRIKSWEKGGLRRIPPGTEEHFLWLRRLLTSRARLAREALGIKWDAVSEMRASQMSLSVFFDEDKRKLFGVAGIRASLEEFFRIRTPIPLARSA
ncbi:MAG TPA: hypothetical protein VLJ37_01480 [bacterium]|nr:hypothetical protein [bacterium]